ncbi:hypothetical protein Zmor_020732 [Zophobas morio]|uniref:Uncharacterized protein n=1 Tax=Zophobas morio TaxID=2755281 RepID=A0AA38MAM5_9CUCU|nr:hypothetical protein Zmor_020732 [Zophobas morio]
MFPPETGLISQPKPVNVFSVAFGCYHRHHRSVKSQDTPFTAFANLMCHEPKAPHLSTPSVLRYIPWYLPKILRVHPNMLPSLTNTLTPNSLLLTLNPSPALSDHHNTAGPSRPPLFYTDSHGL